LIRMVAVDLVADMGFPVYEAGGADEAIGVLERRRDIGAVFTDVNMPGTMDGLELAQCVRRRWPSIGLIVASGRPQSQARAIPPGSVFLSKPYRIAQVARILREMVGEEAAVC
jgi:two-component system, response regulator PdtaR